MPLRSKMVVMENTAGNTDRMNAMQINDEASGRHASGTKLTSQCRVVTKI